MDELHVELAGVVERSGDGLLGDLVKHHPFHGNLGRQELEQVPADALTLAVFISREEQLVSPLEGVLELLDHLLLVLGNHVERFEVGFGVHTEIGPLLSLVSGWNLAGVVGQVAHMAHGGLHPVSLGEETTDGSSLRRALDDDQGVRHVRQVTVTLFIAPRRRLQRMPLFSTQPGG